MDTLAEKLLEQFANRMAEKVANSTVSTEQAAKSLLTAIRWEPRPDRNPPAIVIMRRGGKKKGVSNVLAVISATGEFADLYPSWEPVLADWKRKRSANGGRTSHDGLSVGSVPLAEGEKE